MMSKTWKQYLSVLSSLSAVAFGLFVLAGCSSDAPTVSSGPPTFSGNNVPFAWVPGPDQQAPASLSNGSGTWQQIVEKEIDEDGGVVVGGRYTINVPEGAVDDDVDFTIQQRDASVLDVEFGPHGTDFNGYVEVVIDYSGTNVDPDSPNYDGTSPGFWYYSPAADEWSMVPGKNDTSTKTYTVRLEHFSRYGIFGTPGWYGTWGTPGW